MTITSYFYGGICLASAAWQIHARPSKSITTLAIGFVYSLALKNPMNYMFGYLTEIRQSTWITNDKGIPANVEQAKDEIYYCSKNGFCYKNPENNKNHLINLYENGNPGLMTTCAHVIALGGELLLKRLHTTQWYQSSSRQPYFQDCQTLISAFSLLALGYHFSEAFASLISRKTAEPCNSNCCTNL